MKHVMLAEPTTMALFGMGMFMLLLLTLLGAIIFLIVHFSRKSGKLASPSVSPVAPSTRIIPRQCPQCGAELKPDVSEGLCPACLLQRGLGTEGGLPPGTPPFVPPTIPDLARLFPQLEILELIGKGGMGAVYKARQPALDRFVALKILAPRSGGDLDFAERFTREARALARLSHPNIVAVYDFGQIQRSAGVPPAVPDAGGTPALHYFIMEYVDGPNLRQVEQAGKLSPREALEIIPQICAALQFAHDEGIVHRDIKPENVLLDKKGRVKIADFGLAKILGQEPKDFRLTGARDVVGTPHYMAPEQVEKPQTVDHRADIYSLGVVFYEMLTGELPLGKFQPPSSRTHGMQIDVRLDEVVMRSLEKEPQRRYQHVSEVKTRVENIANTSAPAAAPAVSAGEILARDYTLNIRHCLRRGWALVRNDFWPLVGMSAFVMVVLSAASSSGVVLSDGQSSGTTSILGILLSGPLMGGLYLYFLKKIRREAAGVETAFTGFRHPFPHLVIAGFLATLLTTLGFLCLILPGIYLFVAWIFTFPLIVDRRLEFWPAMRLSRKIISKHWWKFLGFLLVLALINLAGIAACCVGLFITFPITFAALTYAYEDIIGAVKSPAGASSSLPPIASTTPPAPQPDRFGRRFAIVLACVVLITVAIAIIGILTAIAIPNFIKGRNWVLAHRHERAVAVQPSETASNPAFGPVIERVINLVGVRTNFLITFKTGNLRTPPPEIGSSSSAIYDWARREGVDAGAGIINNNVLSGFDMAVLPAPARCWDELTPAQAARRLDSEPIESFKIMLYGNASLPDTCAFKTHEGGIGILQVTEYVSDPPGLRVHYKFLDKAPEVQPMPTATGSWSPMLWPGEKPDPQKVLDEARQLTSTDHYEEALQRYLWHHNHAREFSSSASINSGLSDWMELGRRYPKAKQALIEIRDQKTRKFTAGQGYYDLFSEVWAINRELQDADATLALFKTIQQQDKELAGQCFGLVEGLLVQRGEYDLCLSYIGDFQANFESIRKSWARMKQWEDHMAEMRQQQSQRLQALAKTNSMFSPVPFSPPGPPEFADNNFVSEVRQLIEILVATGHQADAEKIRDQAVAVLDDPRLKSAIGDAEEKVQKRSTPAATSAAK
jgi:serine/threonine protein kinase